MSKRLRWHILVEFTFRYPTIDTRLARLVSNHYMSHRQTVFFFPSGLFAFFLFVQSSHNAGAVPTK